MPSSCPRDPSIDETLLHDHEQRDTKGVRYRSFVVRILTREAKLAMITWKCLFGSRQNDGTDTPTHDFKHVME
jgi:hypothetical protein